MKTKLKALIVLSLFILLTFSLSLVALAGTANDNYRLYRNNEDSLIPGGIGLLAQISVNTTDDGLNDGDGFCSLREAIEAANTDTSVDNCPAGNGDDTISLPAGTYGLDLAVNGDLEITSTMTISGAGAGITIIEDNVNERIFDIDSSGVATISHVTIRDGRDNAGGGIRNQGVLLLIDSEISQNTATVYGGGIFNEGTGGFVGDLTVTNSTVTDNEAIAGAGGGIFNKDGVVTIISSAISLNNVNSDTSVGVGGGIANSAENGSATLTINQSSITTNTVTGVGGGGISNSADDNRTATVTMSQTLVSGNDATSSVINSTRGFGGGIRNGFFTDATNSSAILTVNNSTISGNSAFNGGGIGSGTTTAGNPTLILTVNNSTINDNTADGSGSPGSELVGNGGGLVNQNGTMSLVNSTVSGNTATGGTGLGGGLANSSAGLATTSWISNTTITGNTASDAGDAVVAIQGSNNSTVNFRNSIIAGGCFKGIPGLLPATEGTLTSLGYNMDDGNTCDLTDPPDFTNTNPALGSLQDNGGDTETHALSASSPAIDTGICSGAPNTDQRGQARPNAISAFCDIGAYESNLLGTADLEITKVVTPTQADPGQAVTYTITFANNGPASAGNVVITDVVPLTVTGVASTSSGVTITATAGVTFSWTVGTLARGGSGTITITGLINPSAVTGTSFINTALITAPNDNDSDSATVDLGEVTSGIFLPIILKDFSS